MEDVLGAARALCAQPGLLCLGLSQAYFDIRLEKLGSWDLFRNLEELGNRATKAFREMVSLRSVSKK